MNLLCSSALSVSLADFAKEFLQIVGGEVELRESSNYVDGYYFRIKTECGLEYKVTLNEDSDEWVFWVVVSGIEGINAQILDDIIKNKIIRSGMRVAKVENYGKKEQTIQEYI